MMHHNRCKIAQLLAKFHRYRKNIKFILFEPLFYLKYVCYFVDSLQLIVSRVGGIREKIRN